MSEGSRAEHPRMPLLSFMPRIPLNGLLAKYCVSVAAIQEIACFLCGVENT